MLGAGTLAVSPFAGLGLLALAYVLGGTITLQDVERFAGAVFVLAVVGFFAAFVT